jgi:hypothetical protein
MTIHSFIQFFFCFLHFHFCHWFEKDNAVKIITNEPVKCMERIHGEGSATYFRGNDAHGLQVFRKTCLQNNGLSILWVRERSGLAGA